MQSERRLHPVSIVFAFISQIRAFVVPAVLVLLGAQSRGGDWQPWMMLFIVPNAIVAMLRYLTYRYRYESHEMVILSGLLFRKERHIPYARIQNIDAVQNVLHRLLNVVEVRVETGGGQTPEATMSVLPVTAFREMRERVFADRHALDSANVTNASSPAPLLKLSIRELMLFGFIENRGAVVIAAAFGLGWELGLFERGFDDAIADRALGGGLIRDLVRGVFGDIRVAPERIALAVAAFAGLLLFIRLLSMGWALVRLYGFHVTLDGDDLRSEFGLLTRVVATVPLRRIQTVSIRETPLHRLFSRASIRADTAGGRGAEVGRADREWLAPLIDRAAAPGMVRRLLGEMNLADVTWQPVAPRAFRREIKGWLILALVVQFASAGVLGWSSLWLAPFLIVWAAICARQTVRHTAWAETSDAILFRAGWLWRRTSIVRYTKIQTVTLATSPFDRRTAMARVRVDTAGSSIGSRIDIPYLECLTAVALHGQLSQRAAAQQFRW
jgi:putative membrane protein